ncbi:MAG: BON domain-containing protein [Maricaulaceae bacterium]
MRRFIAGLTIALTALAAGCATPQVNAGGVNNASAEMAIKSRMFRSTTAFSGVDVIVVDGVALLIGHVPDEATKEEAGRIAWSAPNVRDVGNELVISPDGRTLRGANDQVLLSQVRARLLAADVRARTVHVEVYNGVVYLLGRARTQAEATEIAEIASYVGGVDRVVSFVRGEG